MRTSRPPLPPVPWKEGLEPTYPMTPVDCLISELRELVEFGWMTKETFEGRIAQFKDEVTG